MTVTSLKSYSNLKYLYLDNKIKSYLGKELILGLLCFKPFNFLLNSPVFVQHFHRCPLTMKIRAKS